MFAFDAPLPFFDEVFVYSFSPSSSVSTSPDLLSDPLPPPVDLASMPVPPTRPSARNKNPDHIPRPRNAFMLFRSAFAAAQKVSSKIEHDNRHITRIIAHCWNRLSDAEKQIWRDKAAAEKALHRERYPDYRFSPVGRTNKPKKRQVRRNGDKDVKRCAKVADLVMAGKSGDDLERAMSAVDRENGDDERVVAADLDAFPGDEKPASLFVLDAPSEGKDADHVAPFRSPLLPPVLPDDNVMPQPLVTAIAPLEPPAGAPHLDLAPLLPYQYYQPNDSRPAHYQSVVAFLQDRQATHAGPEQSVPEYSAFAWDPSNDFSYYH